MRKAAGKPFAVLLIALLLIGIPKLAGLVADIWAYDGIDPDGAYAWVSVHHIVQALAFLPIMLCMRRIPAVDFGLTARNANIGMRYVLRFSLFFCIYAAGAYAIAIATESLQPFAYPMTASNVVGHLAFQLLLSGPSEELIFRAFAITALGLVTGKRIWNGRVSAANLLAAVLFGLAHVRFSLAPFTLSFSVFQIAYAMVLGVFYGDCYEKSGSVLYPMLMHSVSNVCMSGLSVLTTWLLV